MKINSPQTINFNRSRVLANGKKITSIDEQSSVQELEIYISEDLDTSNGNPPLVIVLDSTTPLVGDVIQGKKFETEDEIILGVLANQNIKAGNKARVITKGIVSDDTIPVPVLNKQIYVSTNGELTTAKLNFSIRNVGRIVNTSPVKIFVDVNNELQYTTNFENYLGIESQNLEAALRKLRMMSDVPDFTQQSSDRCPWQGAGGYSVPVSIAFVNDDPERKNIGVIIFRNHAWYSSNKGRNWSSITSIFLHREWNKVVYGNGTFVAIGDTGVGYSTNGIDWTVSADITGKSIVYGNGLFVTVGTNSSYSSPDGITWTPITIPSGAWTDITFVDLFNKFLAIKSGGAAKLPDPYTTWTAVTTPAGAWYGIVYGNGRAIADSGAAQIYSDDYGDSWVLSPAPASLGGNLYYGSFLFVSGGQYSTDGINWTSISNFAPFQTSLAGMLEDNFIFFAGHTGGDTAEGESYLLVL